MILLSGYIIEYINMSDYKEEKIHKDNLSDKKLTKDETKLNKRALMEAFAEDDYLEEILGDEKEKDWRKEFDKEMASFVDEKKDAGKTKSLDELNWELITDTFSSNKEKLIKLDTETKLYEAELRDMEATNAKKYSSITNEKVNQKVPDICEYITFYMKNRITMGELIEMIKLHKNYHQIRTKCENNVKLGRALMTQCMKSIGEENI